MAKGITINTWINDTPRQFLNLLLISFSKRSEAQMQKIYPWEMETCHIPFDDSRAQRKGEKGKVTYHLFLALASRVL